MAVAPSHVEAHITHVDKDGSLIKVYAQTDKINYCYIEKLLYQLRSVFESNSDLKPKTSSDIQVGVVCFAKFEDDTYYRAKIESIQNVQQYMVTVVFIDHGNKAEVHVKDIRLMSKVMNLIANKKLFQDILLLPGLANDYYLYGITTREKEWDDYSLDYLRKRLCNTDLTCTVYENEWGRIIRIVQEEKDPSAYLTKMSKAHSIPLHVQEALIRQISQKKAIPVPEFNVTLPPPQLLMQQPPPARLPNMSQPPPGIRMGSDINSFSSGQSSSLSSRYPTINSSIRPGIPGMTVRRPEVPAVPPPPVHSLQFSTEMLAMGVIHPVFVSHVEDGPYSFAVQVQDEVKNILTDMMANINKLEPQPITSPLNPGSICLGRYSPEKILCRAIVMNVMDDKVKLYFADFGNSEILPYSEIFQIPPQFVVPKVMSHRFTLANLKDIHYTEKEKQLFKDLVANNPNLTLCVTQPEANPIKQYCELFREYKNIKTVLSEKSQTQPMQLRYSSLTPPIMGSQEKVFVSFVLNPGRFFVQLEKNSFSLNQIMSCVATHCRTAQNLPLINMRVGEPCCALYEDNKWYRAEILKVTQDKAFINFVDYGNHEEIEFENLRQITPELVTTVKAQALVCCLTGYETRYNVEEEVCNRLEELILEKKMMMHVLDTTESNVLIVQMLDNKMQDIGTMLEVRAPQSPIYNEYQATTTPTYTSRPPAGEADPGREGAAHGDNSWEERKYPDSKGPRFSKGRDRGPQDRNQREWQAPNKWQHREDTRKSWRSPEKSETPPRFNKEGGRWNDGQKPERRYNKDSEDKPWNKGENRFNKDDSKEGRSGREEGGTGRYNREDSGGSGRFNRDDNRTYGERGGRFSDDDKGGRFGRDSESRGSRFNREDGGGRFNREDGGGRFNREDGGGRFNREDGGGRFNREDGGGRFNREDGGGRFNKTDDDKPWRKRDDDSADWRSTKDKNDGGSWKDRDGSSGYKGGDGGKNWKDRESGGGGWNKDRDSWKDGGGDRKSRFDNDGGFKKGGFSRESPTERSSFRKPWEKGSGDSFPKHSPKSQKPDSVGGIPPVTVKVGSSEDIQVVFTTSPMEFYVQLTSSFDELNELMEKIKTACESGEVSDMSSVAEKVGCLAKYSEDDSWYRGYVEEKSFDTAKVLFVDYGNKEDVSCDKIKELPESMCVLPVQAVKCRLYAVPETAETDAFSALVDGKTLNAQFVAKHFLTKSFQVVLVDNESGTNINTTMGASEEEIQTISSKLGQINLLPLQYVAGTSFTTQMTWYLSPAEFYLQPMDTNPEFRAMMQQMQSLVRTGTSQPSGQLKKDDYVIARFKSDKVLYRALVKEAGYAVTVQFVDYGNTESVDNNSVWAMEPQFATLPIQAFSCSLAGVQPVGDSWPVANSTELDLQFDAETLECTVLQSTDEESKYLVKLSKQGEDLAQKIIEAGFAIASSEDAAFELDTTLLVNQLLRVTLLRLGEDYSLYVQPAPEDAELLSLEAEAGHGIKCCLSAVRDDATDEERAQLGQLQAATALIIHVDAVLPDGLQVTVYDSEGQLLALQANETPAVAKVCSMSVLGTNQKVWIAHASDNGIFLHKVAFADSLSQLLQALYEFYNVSENVELEWAEGDLCCAKSVNDEQWYRAKILKTGDEIKVQYIDYGNEETLPISNLRKLDPSFYTPHTFALKVSLHVSWLVPMENLLELAGETEYNAVVLKSDAGWVVELVDSSGQSLTEKLVELGFAVALENSPFKRVVEGGRFVEGSSIPISVSFIDSPLQLWIFVGDDVELVEALQDRLQEAATKLPSLEEPSDIFAAKFSDGLWYRAVKLNDSLVRFIDYGNSDTVDMSDIKALSADFLEHSEGYAVKVELPVADFTEEATGRLEELLVSSEIGSEEEVVAHILSVKENSIVADILKGGKSVIDILVEEKLGTRLHTVSSGFISHMNSLNDFFIQEVGCEESLKTVSDTMLTAESFDPVSQINVGDIVAALYTEDGLWYRARVTKHSDNETEVLFIDYGNSATATDFRVLPLDLASRSPLAKHCTLQKPNGVITWPESAFEKFIEISADGCTQFEFNSLDQEDPATVALTCGGKCVSEELKLFCDIVVEDAKVLDSASNEYTDYDKMVYISHINSASDFYVQLEGAEAELDILKKELTDVSSFETLEQIKDKEKLVGSLCVDDEQWYRAKILNTTELGSEVLFVDYGNSAIATSFVKLPETLEIKSPVAIHCALGKTRWPEEATNHLVELSGAGSVPFAMKILEEGYPNIVSLMLEGKVIEKELSDLFDQPSTEEKNEVEEFVDPDTLPTEIGSNIVQSIELVYLIHVNSPSDFFLHTAEATQLVEEISERLIAAEDFPSIEESAISQGKMVAAQFDEDVLWYRAKVIDHSENETKVLFIDYGNTAKVARMKNLPEDLLATPPLAMHCSLQMLGCKEWSVKACQTFNKLANGEGVTFSLEVVSEGEPNTVVLYLNGESVAEQLILLSGLVTEEGTDNAEEPFEAASLLDEDEQKDLYVSSSKECTGEIEQGQGDVAHVSMPSDISKKDEEIHDMKSSVVQPPKSQDIPFDISEDKSIRIVEISHFNNTNDFYIQFNDDKDSLMQIADEMFEGENFENMLDSEEILAAKYTVDNLWYRAKILNSDKHGSSVLFVDYGNVDITNEFRKLPNHLAEIKPLAKHCCLKSPRGYWTESTDEKLSSLAGIGGFTFDMKVVEEGDPCVVDFFLDGNSLSQRFCEQEITEKQGEMEKIILQSVENQISENVEKDVEKITDELIYNAVSSGNSEMVAPFAEESQLVGGLKSNQSEVQTPEIKNKPNDENKKNVEEITDEIVLNAVTSSESEAEDKKVHIDDLKSKRYEDVPIHETKPTKYLNEKKEILDKTSPNSSNTSNGVDEEDFEDSKKNIVTKHVDKQMDINVTKEDVETPGNTSPSTPRRSDIDEHIVPGCISSGKPPEES